MWCAKSMVRRLWMPVLIALLLGGCGGSGSSSGDSGSATAAALNDVPGPASVTLSWEDTGAPYSGDGNDTITQAEFTAALALA